MSFGGSPATYERSAVNQASVEDVDHEALDAFVRQRAPGLLARLERDEAALRLGYLCRVGQRLLPSVAGLVAFGHHPQLHQPSWGLAAVRIRGHHLSDLVEVRHDIEGTLLELVRKGLAFVDAHCEHLINQLDPSDRQPEFPRAAVREGLVNALLHRDLRATGRVMVRVFDDRLEIWSPGSTPLSAEEVHALLQHGGVSLPRNPLLAATARVLGLGEQLGRGLPMIQEAVASSGAQHPTLAISKQAVTLTIPSARALSPRDVVQPRD